jgi:peptidoglycan/xylan/chitin deacetylase (PgdA/CDA1 family)
MAGNAVKSFILVLGFAAALCADSASVPILCYHRVSDGKPGNTTVTPEHFRSQMQTLEAHGFHVIPLAELVAWKSGKRPPPAPHSVVVTFDDGHESFFSEAEPIIDELHIPVTQFLEVGCISRGTYCVNWDQVAKLERDPLVDLESHTWSHPSFTREVRRRGPLAYRRFVDFELIESKLTLEKRLDRPVPMLAWPYGIYTPMLLERAVSDGYKVAFSIECRSVTEADSLMAIPRCMVLNSYTGEDFLRFLNLADLAATTTPVNKNWRVMPEAEGKKGR